MPKLYKDDLEIETNLPSEIVTLKSQGFSATKPEPKPEVEDGAQPVEAPAIEASKASSGQASKSAPKSTK